MGKERNRMVVPPMGGSSRRARGRGLIPVGVGVLLIIIGLVTFVYSTQISNFLAPYIPAEPDPGNPAAPTFAWYVPYTVFGVGLAFIGAGANLLRMVFFTRLMGGGMAGATTGGAMSMSPEVLQAQMAAAMSRVQAPQTVKETVVQVRCRNCGSLEAEDAVYCRKCGKPL